MDGETMPAMLIQVKEKKSIKELNKTWYLTLTLDKLSYLLNVFHI